MSVAGYTVTDNPPSGGRRSDLQPTRMTGIAVPQIERTSSIHCSSRLVSNCKFTEVLKDTRTFTLTLSRESGTSIAKAMRMTCDFE